MKQNLIYFAHQPAHLTIGRSERQGFVEQITEPWTCRWSYRGSTRLLTAEPLYVWDGASIPRVGWSIIGLTPGGLADGPSLMHDIAYRAAGGRDVEKMCGCTITDINGIRIIIDRDEADLIFRELCIFAGIKCPRAQAAYMIVRMFGQKFWGGKAPSYHL